VTSNFSCVLNEIQVSVIAFNRKNLEESYTYFVDTVFSHLVGNDTTFENSSPLLDDGSLFQFRNWKPGTILINAPTGNFSYYFNLTSTTDDYLQWLTIQFRKR